jgi:Predicted integral membrane protein linked to a cation pump
MNTKRNLWPYGIILTFVLFISGTIALIVIACRNDSDLVSSNYYEEEIRFQNQIDRMQRGQELGDEAGVAYNGEQQKIVVTVPAGHVQGATQGRIHLYRPSAAGLDRNIELKPDANGTQSIDAAQLQPGLWKVKVYWTANGSDYRVDGKVVVEARPS